MINSVPTFDELYNSAPQEIKDYVDKCKTTLQSPEWHPEGVVYIHMRIVFDRARDFGDINLALSAFFHDLGKADTTALNKKGGWSAINHERVSARLVEKYKKWVGEMGGNWFEVYQIVLDHMRIKYIDQMRRSKAEALRNHKFYDKLMKFTDFDNMKTLTNDEINRYK